MSKNRIANSLDYLPPVVAFAAVVVGIVGTPKWDADATGLERLMPIGWVLLSIGAAALIASILLIARNRRDQVQQRDTRQQIAELGRAQVLRALGHTVFPFCHGPIWRGLCEAPESPADLLNPQRREALSGLNLNADSTYRDGSFEVIKWHRLLQDASIKGVEEIRIALQTYASYLSAEVMEATTRFLHSRFLQYRLLLMHDLIKANTHDSAERPVPFFWAGTDDRTDKDEYREFWELMARAMILCGAEASDQGPRFSRIQ